MLDLTPDIQLFEIVAAGRMGPLKSKQIPL